jgi:hypothetical protein
VIKESSSTTLRPVDIAVKMGVIDSTAKVRNGELHNSNHSTDTQLRDLLNLDNSVNVRVSKSKGTAKYLTEQFVSSASESIELIERALVNRRFRHQPGSFMVI